MSNLLVQVAEISDIKPHPNADRLVVAIVNGFQTVVPTDTLSIGQKVVYFAPDTILSDSLAESLGVSQYLSNGRIRAIKLRGEPSYGIIIPSPNEFNVGDDVTSLYDVKKWEPPVRNLPTQARGDNPLFPKYIDIENLRHYPKVFDDGEIVVLTEKIHGTCSRFGVVKSEDGTLEWLGGCGKGLMRKMPITADGSPDYEVMARQWDTYWFPYTVPGIIQMLTDLSSSYNVVELFGEICGPVQNLDYGSPNKILYFAFDLAIDGKFLDYVPLVDLLNHYGIPKVPVVKLIDYSFDQVQSIAEGMSLVVGADHIREGLVVRPLEEKVHPKVGRLIMKYVSDTYLTSKNKDKEYGEV